MYKAHFGLSSSPFSPTPAPEFIYQSRELREALAHFRYALENREAFLLLTGEVGTGKTTAVQSLLRMLPEGTPVAVVTHSTLDPRELLEEIAIRFGMQDVAGWSKPQLIRALETFFEDQWRVGRQAILILDEAHLLDRSVLEEVRLLSNLEREGGKLLQICLVGQPELAGHLHQNDLRQLRQRISVRYALRPLGREDTAEYVRHRLRVAGAAAPERIFSAEALDLLHRLTNGIPREINVIAGQAMLNAFLEEAPVVHTEHIRSVRGDYGFEGIQPRPPEGVPPPPPPPPLIVHGPSLPEESELEGARSEMRPPSSGESRPAPRPIPLPPPHLRPAPPPGRTVPAPAVGEPRSMERPAPEPRTPEPAPARRPVQLAQGPGLAATGRVAGSRGFLVAALLLAFAAVTLVALNWGRLFGGGSSEPLASSSAPVPAVERPAVARSDPPARSNPETSTATADPLAGDLQGESDAGGAADDASPLDSDGSPPAGQRVDAASPNPPPPTTIVATGGPSELTAQIGSFRSSTYAEEVRTTAEAVTGLRGAVLSADVSGTTWYRVVLGAFSDTAAAETALRPLIRARMIQDVVMKPMPDLARERILGGDAP